MQDGFSFHSQEPSSALPLEGGGQAKDIALINSSAFLTAYIIAS